MLHLFARQWQFNVQGKPRCACVVGPSSTTSLPSGASGAASNVLIQLASVSSHGVSLNVFQNTCVCFCYWCVSSSGSCSVFEPMVTCMGGGRGCKSCMHYMESVGVCLVYSRGWGSGQGGKWEGARDVQSSPRSFFSICASGSRLWFHAADTALRVMERIPLAMLFAH